MADALVPLRRKRAYVSLAPFGLGFQKPRHYLEMLRIGWENRDALGHAYRVLTRGVCDGCVLGTSGLRDWTLAGTHLCLVRLNLLRLNTLGPAPDAVFADAAALGARAVFVLSVAGMQEHSLSDLRTCGDVLDPSDPAFDAQVERMLGVAVPEPAARLRSTAPREGS